MRNITFLFFTVVLFTNCALKSDTLSLKTSSDSINFACEDVNDIRGVYMKNFDVKIYFSKKGANKFCKFTSANIGKKMDILLNKKITRSVIINEPIHCDFISGNYSRMTFNSIKELQTLAKALCMEE